MAIIHHGWLRAAVEEEAAVEEKAAAEEVEEEAAAEGEEAAQVGSNRIASHWIGLVMPCWPGMLRLRIRFYFYGHNYFTIPLSLSPSFPFPSFAHSKKSIKPNSVKR